MGGQFRDRGWEGREVTVRRLELLDILQKNREKHIADYKEAVIGYKETALEKIEDEFDGLKKKVAGLKAGRFITGIVCGFSLPAPECHDKAYDQVIRMMQMEVEDNVKLTAGQFACFVMDDWDWKSSWSASNAAYIGKSQSI